MNRTQQQTLFSEPNIQKTFGKPKPIIPARHAINWYFGNFLMSPGNVLRDEEGYDERVRTLVDQLYNDFEGQKMTHKQFST